MQLPSVHAPQNLAPKSLKVIPGKKKGITTKDNSIQVMTHDKLRKVLNEYGVHDAGVISMAKFQELFQLLQDDYDLIARAGNLQMSTERLAIQIHYGNWVLVNTHERLQQGQARIVNSVPTMSKKIQHEHMELVIKFFCQIGVDPELVGKCFIVIGVLLGEVEERVPQAFPGIKEYVTESTIVLRILEEMADHIPGLPGGRPLVYAGSRAGSENPACPLGREAPASRLWAWHSSCLVPYAGHWNLKLRPWRVESNGVLRRYARSRKNGKQQGADEEAGEQDDEEDDDHLIYEGLRTVIAPWMQLTALPARDELCELLIRTTQIFDVPSSLLALLRIVPDGSLMVALMRAPPNGLYAEPLIMVMVQWDADEEEFRDLANNYVKMAQVLEDRIVRPVRTPIVDKETGAIVSAFALEGACWQVPEISCALAKCKGFEDRVSTPAATLEELVRAAVGHAVLDKSINVADPFVHIDRGGRKARAASMKHLDEETDIFDALASRRRGLSVQMQRKGLEKKKHISFDDPKLKCWLVWCLHSARGPMLEELLAELPEVLVRVAGPGGALAKLAEKTAQRADRDLFSLYNSLGTIHQLATSRVPGYQDLQQHCAFGEALRPILQDMLRRPQQATDESKTTPTMSIELTPPGRKASVLIEPSSSGGSFRRGRRAEVFEPVKQDGEESKEEDGGNSVADEDEEDDEENKQEELDGLDVSDIDSDGESSSEITQDEADNEQDQRRSADATSVILQDLLYHLENVSKDRRWKSDHMKPVLCLSHGSLSASSIISDAFGEAWFMNSTDVDLRPMLSDVARLSLSMLLDCCLLPVSLNQLKLIASQPWAGNEELARWLRVPMDVAAAVVAKLGSITKFDDIGLMQVLQAGCKASSKLPRAEVLFALKAQLIVSTNEALDVLDDATRLAEAWVDQLDPVKGIDLIPPVTLVGEQRRKAWDLQAMLLHNSAQAHLRMLAARTDYSAADVSPLLLLLPLLQHVLEVLSDPGVSPWQKLWAQRLLTRLCKRIIGEINSQKALWSAANVPPSPRRTPDSFSKSISEPHSSPPVDGTEFTLAPFRRTSGKAPLPAPPPLPPVRNSDPVRFAAGMRLLMMPAHRCANGNDSRASSKRGSSKRASSKAALTEVPSSPKPGLHVRPEPIVIEQEVAAKMPQESESQAPIPVTVTDGTIWQDGGESSSGLSSDSDESSFSSTQTGSPVRSKGKGHEIDIDDHALESDRVLLGWPCAVRGLGVEEVREWAVGATGYPGTTHPEYTTDFVAQRRVANALFHARLKHKHGSEAYGMYEVVSIVPHRKDDGWDTIEGGEDDEDDEEDRTDNLSGSSWAGTSEVVDENWIAAKKNAADPTYGAVAEEVGLDLLLEDVPSEDMICAGNVIGRCQLADRVVLPCPKHKEHKTLKTTLRDAYGKFPCARCKATLNVTVEKRRRSMRFARSAQDVQSPSGQSMGSNPSPKGCEEASVGDYKGPTILHCDECWQKEDRRYDLCAACVGTQVPLCPDSHRTALLDKTPYDGQPECGRCNGKVPLAPNPWSGGGHEAGRALWYHCKACVSEKDAGGCICNDCAVIRCPKQHVTHRLSIPVGAFTSSCYSCKRRGKSKVGHGALDAHHCLVCQSPKAEVTYPTLREAKQDVRLTTAHPSATAPGLPVAAVKLGGAASVAHVKPGFRLVYLNSKKVQTNLTPERTFEQLGTQGQIVMKFEGPLTEVTYESSEALNGDLSLELAAEEEEEARRVQKQEVANVVRKSLSASRAPLKIAPKPAEKSMPIPIKKQKLVASRVSDSGAAHRVGVTRGCRLVLVNGRDPTADLNWDGAEDLATLPRILPPLSLCFATNRDEFLYHPGCGIRCGKSHRMEPQFHMHLFQCSKGHWLSRATFAEMEKLGLSPTCDLCEDPLLGSGSTTGSCLVCMECIGIGQTTPDESRSRSMSNTSAESALGVAGVVGLASRHGTQIEDKVARRRTSAVAALAVQATASEADGGYTSEGWISQDWQSMRLSTRQSTGSQSFGTSKLLSTATSVGGEREPSSQYCSLCWTCAVEEWDRLHHERPYRRDGPAKCARCGRNDLGVVPKADPPADGEPSGSVASDGTSTDTVEAPQLYHCVECWVGEAKRFDLCTTCAELHVRCDSKAKHAMEKVSRSPYILEAQCCCLCDRPLQPDEDVYHCEDCWLQHGVRSDRCRDCSERTRVRYVLDNAGRFVLLAREAWTPDMRSVRWLRRMEPQVRTRIGPEGNSGLDVIITMQLRGFVYPMGARLQVLSDGREATVINIHETGKYELRLDGRRTADEAKMRNLAEMTATIDRESGDTATGERNYQLGEGASKKRPTLFGKIASMRRPSFMEQDNAKDIAKDDQAETSAHVNCHLLEPDLTNHLPAGVWRYAVGQELMLCTASGWMDVRVRLVEDVGNGHLVDEMLPPGTPRKRELWRADLSSANHAPMWMNQKAFTREQRRWDGSILSTCCSRDPVTGALVDIMDLVFNVRSLSADTSEGAFNAERKHASDVDVRDVDLFGESTARAEVGYDAWPWLSAFGIGSPWRHEGSHEAKGALIIGDASIGKTEVLRRLAVEACRADGGEMVPILVDAKTWLGNLGPAFDPQRQHLLSTGDFLTPHLRSLYSAGSPRLTFLLQAVYARRVLILVDELEALIAPDLEQFLIALGRLVAVGHRVVVAARTEAFSGWAPESNDPLDLLPPLKSLLRTLWLLGPSREKRCWMAEHQLGQGVTTGEYVHPKLKVWLDPPPGSERAQLLSSPLMFSLLLRTHLEDVMSLTGTLQQTAVNEAMSTRAISVRRKESEVVATTVLEALAAGPSRQQEAPVLRKMKARDFASVSLRTLSKASADDQEEGVRKKRAKQTSKQRASEQSLNEVMETEALDAKKRTFKPTAEVAKETLRKTVALRGSEGFRRGSAASSRRSDATRESSSSGTESSSSSEKVSADSGDGETEDDSEEEEEEEEEEDEDDEEEEEPTWPFVDALEDVSLVVCKNAWGTRWKPIGDEEGTYEDLLQVLQTLAFHVEKFAAVDFTELDVKKACAEEAQQEIWNSVVPLIKRGKFSLVCWSYSYNRKGRCEPCYRFAHPLLQAYLASREVLKRWDTPDAPLSSIEELLQSGSKERMWNSVTPFLAERLEGPLSLRMRDASESVAVSVAFFMKVSAAVTYLDYRGVGLGQNNSSLVQLGKAFSTDKTLLHLNLSSNALGSNGVGVICEALRKHRTLQELNLSTNHMGYKGAGFVGRLLRQCHTIATLDLSENSVGSDGALVLGECLMDNLGVKQLDLRRNNITQETLQQIKDYLMQPDPEKRVRRFIDTRHNRTGCPERVVIDDLPATARSLRRPQSLDAGSGGSKSPVPTPPNEPEGHSGNRRSTRRVYESVEK